ncbi:MAG: acyl carrier protein [Spartobacteria bacterium]|nr:acyl carrier protein [Spartobacteria bacterium]
MNNLEKYADAFRKIFAVAEEALPALAYQSITQWDSVGHMRLMAEIESAFGILLDTEDIVGFSSYETGKAILRKYGVEL